MTNAEILAVFVRECPNGVSFDPMAVRLLRQKVPLNDSQIDYLKAEMIQLENGLWFSCDMISDDESLFEFYEQATKWLETFGCFSIERLFVNFAGVIRHIASTSDCARLLTHLGFTITVWGNCDHFCFLPSNSLDVILSSISENIGAWLKETEGMLSLHEIELAMPHLTANALKEIRIHFLPEVHEVEVGGVPCWRCSDAIPLPEDFSEKLTTIVDTLVALNEKVSAAKLEFALNLFYRSRFRDEFILKDNDSFMRICAKHYQGRNSVFPKTKQFRTNSNERPIPVKRVRSPNTRFRNLDVPIGAELVFTGRNHITCIVLDDSNHVGFDGKSWAISALAIHLLDVPVANGFCHFSYEGETLWERRLRREREGKQLEDKVETVDTPAEEFKRVKKSILGLEGRPLAKSTWRVFKRAGTDPRVAGWELRVEKGERLSKIARESGLTVLTVKEYIKNRHRYLAVCEKNGIQPEASADV